MFELRTMIVDDEPLAVRRIAIALAKIEGAICIGSAAGCEEALSKFATLRPDVVLLDIGMRDGTGFDFLERLPEGSAPAVIFVTAFDHFAVRAFESSAADYVLKPLETRRLEAALARARKNLALKDAEEKFANLRATIDQLRAEIRQSQKPPVDDIWAHNHGGGHVRVRISDIEYARSEGEYVRIHVAGRSHLIRMSIRKLEEKLPSGEFVRIHRSAIARVSQIQSFRNKSLGGAEVVLRCGVTLPAGRVYAQLMRTALLKSTKGAQGEMDAG
ncbi:MAG: LytR/AlgR family response regulator transcription factor [Pseudomonadota bacterium]